MNPMIVLAGLLVMTLGVAAAEANPIAEKSGSLGPCDYSVRVDRPQVDPFPIYVKVGDNHAHACGV
jgi:hypothetical protein